MRHQSNRRVDRRPTNGNQIFDQRATAIARLAATGENPSEEVFGKAEAHSRTQKGNLITGRNTAGSREDLQRNFIAVDLDDLSEGFSPISFDFGQFFIADIGCLQRRDVSGQLVNSVVVCSTTFPD